jgi:uncharacterized protein YecT (DUF1311 family)
MKHPVHLPVFIFLAVLSSSSQAQVRQEDECVRLHPSMVSPVEMADCTSDLAGSEQTLANAFLDLRSQVPKEYQDALDASQLAWAKFRAAQCEWEAGGSPGSTDWSSSVIACTADLNRQRAKFLADDLKERWQ